MTAPPTAVAIGEVMLELSAAPGGGWRLGQAGDTYNTAVYLRRAGLAVGYLTALGADPLSADIRADLVAEGLDPALLLTDPDRLPGLYLIRTDAAGERRFFYWRQASAARNLFALPGVEAALARAAAADLLYCSGITLSLFDGAGRDRLVECARAASGRGGLVAFDPNYRPAGWAARADAQAAIAAIAPHVAVALPTVDDERALWDDATPYAAADRWLAAGARVAAVKLGAQGCLVATPARRQIVPPARAVAPLDTTGAGDAFNAAFLAAWLAGGDPIACAQAGNALAGEVIAHPGAIIAAPAGQ